MGYQIRTIDGELKEYAFDIGGVLALRNFTAVTNGNRLIIQSATNANFTILDALVNEVEIDGVVYDNPTAAQEALQRLVFNPVIPVIMTQAERDELGKVKNKVDKENGKGLTTNDFTTELKLKLENLDISLYLPHGGYTGTAQTLKADIDSKANTNHTHSDLAKITDLANKLDKGNYAGTAQTLKTNIDAKVDKVTGKQLSSEDFTTFEKNKLAGLQNYTLPTLLSSIKQTDLDNWNTAFGKRTKSLSITGDVNKTITITLEDGQTISASFKDNDNGNPNDIRLNSLSFNKTTGVITAVTSDNKTITANLDGRYAPISHTHTIAQVEGLQTALNSKANTNHTHTIAQVEGLQTALNSKANTNHTHTIAQVEGLQTALNSKANTNHTHSDLAKITDLANKLDKGNYAGTAQTLKTNIDAKVDKVTGKQLSSEDFTTFEKNKLAGLQNYTLPTLLSGIKQTDLDNWNTAFGKRTKSLSITGDVNKTITITLEDGQTISASFKDNDNGNPNDIRLNSLSFNKTTGVITAVTSDNKTITANIDGRYAPISHTHDISQITGMGVEITANYTVLATDSFKTFFVNATRGVTINVANLPNNSVISFIKCNSGNIFFSYAKSLTATSGTSINGAIGSTGVYSRCANKDILKIDNI